MKKISQNDFSSFFPNHLIYHYWVKGLERTMYLNNPGFKPTTVPLALKIYSQVLDFFKVIS